MCFCSRCAVAALSILNTHAHIVTCFHTCIMGIVNADMQTYGLGLLSKSQVADTSAPSLPASMLVKWECPACFFFCKTSRGLTTGPCQLHSSCSGPLFEKTMPICSLFVLCIACDSPPSAHAQLPTSCTFE